MGWYYTSNLGQHETPKSFLDTEHTAKDGDRQFRVLRSAIVARTYYAAVEITRGETRDVFGLVCLTERDGGRFGFKPIDEGAGPYQYDCPVAILDLLTPTDNELASKWRRRCRERAQATAETSSRTDSEPPSSAGPSSRLE